MTRRGRGKVNKSSGSLSFDREWNPVTVKQAMIKALVLGGAVSSEIEASRVIKERTDEWSQSGAVDAVLDLDALLYLHEISDTLRQCVDAYVCNIEGNGHILKPKIDLDKADWTERVSDIIEAEEWQDQIDTATEKGQPLDSIDVTPPSETEVKERADILRRQVRREMHIAKAWFSNCSPKESWEWLREKKRVDQEVVGHGAWEVLRDDRGKIRRFEHIPGHTILPMTDDGKRVFVERIEWITDVSYTTVRESLMFRRYVQREDGKTRYFREFGDPRAMDSDTGDLYEAKYKENEDGTFEVIKTAEEVMKSDRKDAIPATEVIYFPVESPHTPAGMIRWAGWIVGVFGNRAAAESNLAYFENHAIPEAALLIGGGELGDESIDRVRGQLKKQHQGVTNHHRLLVLHALAKATKPGDKAESPEMKWINLSEYQKGDANFAKYTESNQNGITSSFRQSPILTGRIPSDLNRATAWAVLFQADRQVYGPLRRAFDRWVNTVLLPSIGCYAIRFESLSPVGTDIETMSKALETGIKGGAFSPNEIRALFALWMNEPFESIEAEWANLPFQMTLNQLSPDGTSAVTPEDEAAAQKEFKTVLRSLEDFQAKMEGDVGAEDGMVSGIDDPPASSVGG